MIPVLLGVALAGPCASSCAAPGAGEGIAPDAEVLAHWIEVVRAAGPDRPDPALDDLVFHAREALDHLDGGPEDWLVRELGRTRVEARFTLVSPDGEELAAAREELTVATKRHVILGGALGPVDVNGRVVRVGARHLWARF